jgi:hypothetical protein
MNGEMPTPNTPKILRQAMMVLLGLWIASAARAADWQAGQFLSDGKPVGEHHCAPSTPGGHPAIILLHGAGGYGPGEFVFENLCSDLAEHWYYVESIEYFSQTGGEVGPITLPWTAIGLPSFVAPVNMS